jgi:hypothetical protein
MRETRVEWTEFTWLLITFVCNHYPYSYFFLLPSIYPSIHQSIYLSICVSTGEVEWADAYCLNKHLEQHDMV